MHGLSIPVLIMIGVSVYAGVYHLLFQSVNGRREGFSHLYFGTMSLFVALYDVCCIMLYRSSAADASIAAQRGQFVSLGVIAMLLTLWIHELTNAPRLQGRIIALVFAVNALIPLLPIPYLFDAQAVQTRTMLGHTFMEAVPQGLVLVLYASFIIGIGIGVFLLVRAIIMSRSHMLVPTIIGFGVFFVAAAADILTGMGLTPLPYLLEYSFLAVMLGMMHSHVIRYRDLRDAQEKTTEKLERQVEERTSEIRMFVERLKEQNRQLQEMTERDGMTGLYNHAAFQMRLKAMLNASRRHSFPIAVLVMDIDLFKEYNDTYGHSFGDSVIKKVADVLKTESRDYDIKAHIKDPLPEIATGSAVRNYDIVARYGGDEFAVILLFCGSNETGIVCKRLIDGVEAIRFPEQPSVRVAISLGAVTLDAKAPCRDNNALFKQADAALYEVKRRRSHDSLIVPFDENAV